MIYEFWQHVRSGDCYAVALLKHGGTAHLASNDLPHREIIARPDPRNHAMSRPQGRWIAANRDSFRLVEANEIDALLARAQADR